MMVLAVCSFFIVCAVTFFVATIFNISILISFIIIMFVVGLLALDLT